MSIMKKVVEGVAQVMPDRERDKLIEQHRYIGKPVDRLDGRAKVMGAAKFSAEYPVEKLVYAALAYSTIAKGKIKSIDTSKAESAPGVIKVLTHLNAPKMKVAPPFSPAGDPTSGTSAVEILNTDQITWNGQPVAVVVANTEERAEEAAAMIAVEYEAESAMTSFEEAMKTAHTPKQILGDQPWVKKGEADEALKAATHRVDMTFTTPPYNHNAIEPHATIAWWEGEDKLHLYDTTQFTAGTANTIAKVFGIKTADVRLKAPYVGGGFGGKGGIWPYIQLCVLAARVTKLPVRVALTREGVFRIVGGRTPSQQRVAIAVNEEGTFASFIHEGVTAQSTDNDFPEQFSFPPRHMYSMENYRIGQQVCEVNRVANTFMRAPGESIGTFAVESAIDAVAWEAKIDPLELRRRNEPEKDPVSGHDFSSRHLLEAYTMGAEKFGWKWRPETRTQRDGDWLIGHGMANGTYPVYRMVTAARVRIGADGTALIQTAAQEMGMGTATVQTQHAAELLGLPMEKVTFEYGDSSLPFAGVAGGSSQTVSIAMAVQIAGEKVLKEIFELAEKEKTSVLHGASFDEVYATQEGLFRKGQPAIGETYTTILQRAKKDFVEHEEKAGAPREIMKYSMHSFVAHFCEVGVHAHTGEVRIRRWVAAFDTGRIINPKTAMSQFRGGIIMGIGMALTEETMFDDRTGRIMNATLAEYHVPVQADVPYLEVLYTDAPDPVTPMGAHGIGEIGITGVAAAVANAVYQATGKRVVSLPITLDKVM